MNTMGANNKNDLGQTQVLTQNDYDNSLKKDLTQGGLINTSLNINDEYGVGENFNNEKL